MKTLKSAVLLFFAAAVLAASPFAAAHQGDAHHQFHLVPHPLHHAAFHNNVAEIERILARIAAAGGGVFHKGEIKGASARISEIRVDVARMFAEKRNTTGSTALHWAVWGNAKEVVEMMLANGASAKINAKSAGGSTPLHNAAFINAKEVAELLLDYGAYVNAKDDNGNTPLHVAAQKNAERENAKETAELLLANGAQINAKNNNGETPLHLAEKFEDKETAELLSSYTPGQFAHLRVGKKNPDSTESESSSATPKTESDYVSAWCKKQDGDPEAKLKDGTWPDCLTAKYAVEFDFGWPQKSYECMGQALHYAKTSGLKPLCILIWTADIPAEQFATAVERVAEPVEVRCINEKGLMFNCDEARK